ncbi:MAG: ASCH domain-containing protein [Actinomycetes bacterium]
MRALSVRQPWADDLVRGRKTVENRSWRTTHRGPLLVHAARTDARPGVPADLPRGALVGVVTVVDCVRDHPDGEPGYWHWVITDPGPLPEPIACIGRPGLWTPAAKVTVA